MFLGMFRFSYLMMVGIMFSELAQVSSIEIDFNKSGHTKRMKSNKK